MTLPILPNDSGVWDTVDRICIAAIFVLLVVALAIQAYDEDYR